MVTVMTKHPKQINKVDDKLHRRTWWRDATYIAAIAGVISVVIPLTATINKVFEVDLQRDRLTHEIRLKYLDKVIDPNLDLPKRELIFDFLVATLEDEDPMKKWANKKLEKIKLVQRLQRETIEKSKKLSQTIMKLRTEKRRDSLQALELRVKSDSLVTKLREEIDVKNSLLKELKQDLVLPPSKNIERRIEYTIYQEESYDEYYNATITINGEEDWTSSDEQAYYGYLMIGEAPDTIVFRGIRLEYDLFVSVTEYDFFEEEIYYWDGSCNSIDGACSLIYITKHVKQAGE